MRRLLPILALFVAALAAARPFGSAPLARGVILAAANVGGREGTFWRTDVWIHNPANEAADVSFTLLPAGRSGESEGSFGRLRVEPGETTEIPNLLGYFGVREPAAAVEWRIEAGPAVFVQSRTSSGEAPSPAIAASSLADAGSVNDPLHLQSLRRGTSFRTNLIVVNPENATAIVDVELLDDAGDVVLATELALDPRSQSTVLDFGSAARFRRGHAILRPRGEARILATASVVGSDGSALAVPGIRQSRLAD